MGKGLNLLGSHGSGDIRFDDKMSQQTLSVLLAYLCSYGRLEHDMIKCELPNKLDALITSKAIHISNVVITFKEDGGYVSPKSPFSKDGFNMLSFMNGVRDEIKALDDCGHLADVLNESRDEAAKYVDATVGPVRVRLSSQGNVFMLPNDYFVIRFDNVTHISIDGKYKMRTLLTETEATSKTEGISAVDPAADANRAIEKSLEVFFTSRHVEIEPAVVGSLANMLRHSVDDPFDFATRLRTFL